MRNVDDLEEGVNRGVCPYVCTVILTIIIYNIYPIK
jgi:hypothetical protein